MKSIKNVTLFVALFCIAFLDAAEDVSYAKKVRGGRIPSTKTTGLALATTVTMPPTSSCTGSNTTTITFGDLRTAPEGQEVFFPIPSQLPPIPKVTESTHNNDDDDNVVVENARTQEQSANLPASFDDLTPGDLRNLADALSLQLIGGSYNDPNIASLVKNMLNTKRITTKRLHATLDHQGKQVLEKEELLKTLQDRIDSTFDDGDWQKSNKKRDQLLAQYRQTEQEICELLTDIHGLRDQQSFTSKGAELLNLEAEQKEAQEKRLAARASLQAASEWPQATQELTTQQYSARLKALRTAFDSAPTPLEAPVSKAQQRRYEVLASLHARKAHENYSDGRREENEIIPTDASVKFNDSSFNNMWVYEDGLLDSVNDSDTAYASQREEVKTLIEIAEKLGDKKKAKDLQEALRLTELAPFDKTLLNRPEEPEKPESPTELPQDEAIVVSQYPERETPQEESSETTSAGEDASTTSQQTPPAPTAASSSWTSWLMNK